MMDMFETRSRPARGGAAISRDWRGPCDDEDSVGLAMDEMAAKKDVLVWIGMQQNKRVLVLFHHDSCMSMQGLSCARGRGRTPPGAGLWNACKWSDK